jgi:hypothetical protein
MSSLGAGNRRSGDWALDLHPEGTPRMCGSLALSAEEQLVIISGTVLAEMTGHPATRLDAGGFAVMGGRMAHQFTCLGKSPCVMFVVFDRAYDIFWGKDG